jgi:hypothetical protein
MMSKPEPATTMRLGSASWRRSVGRIGHLARLPGGPLPGESAEELQLLAAEDQRRADEGLVELRSPRGEVSYKHIDELTPEDRQARAEAERVLMSWIIERQRGRRPPPSRFYSRMQ